MQLLLLFFAQTGEPTQLQGAGLKNEKPHFCFFFAALHASKTVNDLILRDQMLISRPQ